MIAKLEREIESAYKNLESAPGIALGHLEKAFLLLDPFLKTTPWIPNRTRLEGAGDMYSIPQNWRLARAQALAGMGELEIAYQSTL